LNRLGSGSSIGGDPGLVEVLLAWTSGTKDLVMDLVAVGVVVDGDGVVQQVPAMPECVCVSGGDPAPPM
jgi:hypothetical protein